ncbi:MAG: ABC transporter permease [Streptococcaceae bacterium]|jgi:peptide/nickel transport system permease protein|nr:ABC transporter permease [Streptococcaceae bacterium]MCH4178022.1 ABC transporter permease [Streptococcaceae bacterium]
MTNIEMSEEQKFSLASKNNKHSLDDKHLAIEKIAIDSSYSLLRKRFASDKIAIIGMFVFIILIIVAIFAPQISPYDPNKTVGMFEAGPTSSNLLGTDEIGRDVLSRLIFGTRVSMFVGILSVAIYAVIGTVLGLISGYMGGVVDVLIMRFTEVFMSFPYILVCLVVVSVIGPNIVTVTAVIGVLGWPTLCRLVRGEVMKLKRVDYVLAAISSGYSTPMIIFKHLFPNILSLILVNMTFGVATSILTEASLSFLGAGVQPPTASWGNMMSNAQSLTVLLSQWWRWLPAGILILISVLSVNFFGDGLRKAIEGEIK